MIRLTNIGLRALTLASKFLLLLFLAKFLSPGEVGVYGLLVAGIGYALYVVGLDFYNYSTREMLGRDRRFWLGMIRDQAALYGALYVLIVPLVLLVFVKGWLPWEYVVWFFVLLFLEHVAQELNRILITMSAQLLASVVLFLRSGFWALIVIAIMWAYPSTRTIEFCLAAWAAGVFAACAVGGQHLYRLDRHSLRLPIDWRWVAAGIKVALPLLAASLALRGIFTFDRFWVESLSGPEVLGAYVLYAGMVTAVLSFLDAGVVVFFYPRLVEAAKHNNDVVFNQGMHKLRINVWVATLVMVLLCGLIAPLLLPIIGHQTYSQNIDLLYWLLAAVFLHAVSLVPHLGLYAKGSDRPIVQSQVAGFMIFVFLVYLQPPAFGAVAVPVAMCISFVAVWVWKAVAYRAIAPAFQVSRVNHE